MTATVREHPALFGLAGAIGAAAVWYALASMTGLIFHAMPAGPTLAAAWIARRAGIRASGWVPRAGVLMAGASIAVAMSVIIGAAGHALDEFPLTALAISGGVAIGAWLLRVRRPRPEAAGMTGVGQRTFRPGMDE